MIYSKGDIGLPRRTPDTASCPSVGIGWPSDHKVEDTFALPPLPTAPTEPAAPEGEFKVGYSDERNAWCVNIHTAPTLVGTFASFEYAQLAAEALNNHKGY